MKSPIILLGYMGCGKTKVGKKLSKKIGILSQNTDRTNRHYEYGSKHLFRLCNDAKA